MCNWVQINNFCLRKKFEWRGHVNRGYANHYDVIKGADLENGSTILWEDIYNFSFSGFLFCIGNRKFCSSIAKETYTIVCHFCKFCGRFSYWLQILFGKEASSVSKCSTSNYTKTERKLEHRNSVSYSFFSISGKSPLRLR